MAKPDRTVGPMKSVLSVCHVVSCDVLGGGKLGQFQLCSACKAEFFVT